MKNAINETMTTTEASNMGDKDITGAMSAGCILTIQVALLDSINRGRDVKACEFALSEFESAMLEAKPDQQRRFGCGKIKDL
jgi:hypothetical protein